MISLLFEYLKEPIVVRIAGDNLFFIKDNVVAPLRSLKLSYAGVIKELPQLKDDPEWRDKALEIFKVRFSQIPDEDKRANYVIQELKRFGYIPRVKQKGGFRPERI